MSTGVRSIRETTLQEVLREICCIQNRTSGSNKVNTLFLNGIGQFGPIGHQRPQPNRCITLLMEGADNKFMLRTTRELEGPEEQILLNFIFTDVMPKSHPRLKSHESINFKAWLGEPAVCSDEKARKVVVALMNGSLEHDEIVQTRLKNFEALEHIKNKRFLALEHMKICFRCRTVHDLRDSRKHCLVSSIDRPIEVLLRDYVKAHPSLAC